MKGVFHMYVIAGATGHIGSVAAGDLLASGKPVRVIVRDSAKGERFAQQGAEVAVGTLEDVDFLTGVLRDADAAFLLVPPNYASDDYPAYQRGTADAICKAVKDSEIPHVVALSSIGADQETGLGPIDGLNYFERRLAETDAKLTALRPGWFMENLAEILEPAKQHGIYASFMPEDLAMPMIATRDIGAEVARSMVTLPADSQVVDIVGPSYSAVDAAKLVGERLGTDLQIVTVPPDGWVDALSQSGLPQHFAELYAEMYTGLSKGLAQPVGDKLVEGTTTLDTVLDDLIEGATHG
jgi:uncharacterized protein YbjT (DUF2867 family)